MAKKEPVPAPAAEAATEPTADVVKLKCDALGVESKDFTPKHAKDLLALEKSLGRSDWQPVTEVPKTND